MSCNIYTVTPSTTLLDVEPSSIVLLNPIIYAGQTFSIQNNFSSTEVLANPILVSTTSNQYFFDGSYSTFIDQPEGYLTIQSLLPSSFTFLNSYPFRSQLLSSGIQNLTVSSFYTATTSTLFDLASKINVDSLIIQNDFIQSTSLVLNTNISTFGNATILSSFFFQGPANLSSKISVSSSVLIQSTLTVYGNILTQSPLLLLSSINIADSLYIQSTLSAGTVALGNSIQGNHIFIQDAVFPSFNIAGSMLILEDAHIFSSVNVGSTFNSKLLTTSSNINFLSTVNINGYIDIENDLRVENRFSTLKSISVLTDTYVISSFLLENNMNISTSLITSGYLDVKGRLTVSTLSAESIFTTFLNQIVPYQTTFSTLFVNGSEFIINSMNASTLTVGGNLSTFSNLLFFGETYLRSSVLIKGDLVVVDDLTVKGDIQINQNATIQNNLSIVSSLKVIESVDCLSTIEASNVNIQGDLLIEGSIFVRNNLFISSFFLPSSVTSVDFYTSTISIGNKGITDNFLVSSLFTSSFQTGDTSRLNTQFVIGSDLYVDSLSSFYLSSLGFEVRDINPSSGFFLVQEQLAIGSNITENKFLSDKLSYMTHNDIYASKVFSTNTVVADTLTGRFVGDAQSLSNVAFPTSIEIFNLNTSTLIGNNIQAESVYASTGTIIDSFYIYSTLQVGFLNIYGNASVDPSISTSYIAATNDRETLIMNNMFTYKNINKVNVGIYRTAAQASIDFSTVNSLYVDGTMRINSIQVSNLTLPFEQLNADTVFVSTIFPLSQFILNTPLYYGNAYVSSGVVHQSDESLFIGKDTLFQRFSTNIIQPVVSTLVFNSTLYVKSGVGVGINTDPNVELDIKDTAWIYFTTQVLQSTFITNQIVYKDTPIPQVNVNQNLWWGFNSSGLWNSTDGQNWSYNTPTLGPGKIIIGGSNGRTGLVVTQSFDLRPYLLTNGDLRRITRFICFDFFCFETGIFLPRFDNPPFPYDQVLQGNRIEGLAYGKNRWVAVGYTAWQSGYNVPICCFAEENNNSNWRNASIPSTLVGFDLRLTSLAFNGSVFVCGIDRSFNFSNRPTTMYSYDGQNWKLSSNIGSSYATNSLVWADTMWIAGGRSLGNDSVYRSKDGVYWTPSPTSCGLCNVDAVGYGNGTVVVGAGTSIKYTRNYGFTWCNAILENPFSNIKNFEWNGTYFLAMKDGGVYKSFDGSYWNQYYPSPNTNPPDDVAWLGNDGFFKTTNFSNLNQPSLVFQQSLPTTFTSLSNSYVATYPSTILYNGGLFTDFYGNMGLGDYFIGPNNFTQGSTLIAGGKTLVSSFFSTQSLQVGLLSMDFTNV